MLINLYDIREITHNKKNCDNGGYSIAIMGN